MNPQWSFTPIVIPLFTAAVVTLGLMIYGIHRGKNQIGRIFTLLMACVFTWSFTTGVEMLSMNVAVRLLIDDAALLMITLIPALWLMLVLEFTGHARGIRWGQYLLFVVPIATNIVIWTNPLHGFWRGTPSLDLTTASFPITMYNYNWWFYYVHAPYSYILVVAGLLLLLLVPSIQNEPHRSTGRLLLLAGLLPAVTDMLYVLDLSPIRHFNVTPIAFTLSGVLIGWAVGHTRFIGFFPIARDLVVENMQDLVLILNEHMQLLDLNPAASETLALNRARHIGQPLEALLPDQPHVTALIQMEQDAHHEVWITEGSQKCWYDLRVSPIQQHGEAAGRLVVMRCIDDRKRAERERERLIEELNAYSYSVAHDIKSPVGAVAGYADMIDLAIKDHDFGALATYSEMISLASYQVIRIVDDLLLLARTRHERDVPRHPLDMATIVDSAIQRIQPSIQFSHAEISMPNHWPSAQGYDGWVEEVWVNLIENATRYGGSPPCIELGAEQQGEMVRFWVRDHGPGIPQEKQARMFRPFEQADADSRNGHGLGLSIVRRIMDRLGGEVAVESPADGGTCFSFTLPAVKQQGL